jgi:hypothetical protein
LNDKPHSPYLVAVDKQTRDAPRQHAPAAARNAAPILDVLRGILPDSGRALEVASGTGQHAVCFAEAFPGMEWQPSDPAPEARNSIAAWVAESGSTNLRPPLELDVTQAGWQERVAGGLDLVACINMIHIAPWEACLGLMEGVGALLRDGGLLYLYGPYMWEGAHTAPSNISFDESLRGRNLEWGVRDMTAVADTAAVHGMLPQKVVAMPANNFSLIFRKRANGSGVAGGAVQ